MGARGFVLGLAASAALAAAMAGPVTSLHAGQTGADEFRYVRVY